MTHRMSRPPCTLDRPLRVPRNADGKRAARGAAAAGSGGFALITALFLLVVLAGFAVAASGFAARAAQANAQTVQGLRALAAARAGLEWAGHQLRDPNNTLAPGTTPRACFPNQSALPLPAAMGSFTVAVTCLRSPADPTQFHDEGGRRVAIYLLTATASHGTAGEAEYVERKLEARIEVCRDAASTAANLAC